MPETKPCRSCGALCTWAKTAANNVPMPLQEDGQRGNVLIDEMGKAHAFRDHDAAIAEQVLAEERYSIPTFIAHHAVCPEGEAWRAKRAAKPKPAAPDPQGSLL